ncbi:MAG: 4-hydroxy-tetrahydrodipicolinate synthase [Pantoea sp. Brub]|nr:4-hydroxy-tetrahydrodipicolinate synthase [Pantoea sp. Brub]
MFKGSIVALITPMDYEGNICFNNLKKLINYHILHKTTAIVIAGTTGESSTLSNEEHITLVMKTVELADGRIPIIAGTGANATNEAIALTKSLEHSGIVGCLSVTPYYNRPSQEGLFQHFYKIAHNTDLPQILYNVPARTGCDILPETVARLSEIKNIVGIKEATGDLTRVNKIKTLIDKDFFLMSGDDSTALDFMQLGGNGVISVTANVAAHEMVQLCKLINKNKIKEARNLNKKLMHLHKILFCEPNPAAVKWTAKKLQLITNDTMRLPMIPITSLNKQKIKQILITIELY